MCSDAELLTPWLSTFVKHLEDNKIGCVVPLVNPPVNTSLDVKPDSGTYNISPDELSMSISLFRKKDIVDIGGFDEKFYLYGHDVDLLNKLSSKYKLVLDSTVMVNHGVGSTTKRVFTKKELEEIDKYTKQINGK